MKLLITRTFCLRTSWQQPIRQMQSGTFCKCHCNTEKVFVKNEIFSTFHTKFSIDFSFGVVKNRKCLAKQMVKLVLPKCRIFCPIFNNLCDIKDFFVLSKRLDRLGFKIRLHFCAVSYYSTLVAKSAFHWMSSATLYYRTKHFR